MMHNEALVREAIKKAGGPHKVGKACGVSRQAVCQWYHNGVSKECVDILAKMTGIDAKVLRPSRRGPHVMADQAA